MLNSDLIVSDPNVMLGKPVVRGTRTTVELILETLEAGQTEDQLLQAHPRGSRMRRYWLHWRLPQKHCAPMSSIHLSVLRCEVGGRRECRRPNRRALATRWASRTLCGRA